MPTLAGAGGLWLEPHLKVAGHSVGETGSELFEIAVDALRAICRQQNIPLASVDAGGPVW